jgi:hypothetical protein
MTPLLGDTPTGCHDRASTEATDRQQKVTDRQQKITDRQQKITFVLTASPSADSTWWTVSFSIGASMQLGSARINI